MSQVISSIGNTVMTTIVGNIVTLLLLSVEHTNGWYSPGASTFCLSCQNVIDPRTCTQFVEIWPNEVCTTDRIMLLNGTNIWNFGYEESSHCDREDLKETRARVRRSSSGFVLCHECCYSDLCNHKLCGSATHSELMCLIGDESRELPRVSHTTHCNRNESCFVSQPYNARPGNFNYNCAPKSICRDIPPIYHDGTCQRCCNTDGCNAHACTRERVDAPSTTAKVSVSVVQTHTSDTYSHTSQSSIQTTTQIPHFSDCWSLRTQGGFTVSGSYRIYPVRGPNASLWVHCDMETDGGGWTVLQRRFDGSVNFTRSMYEYELGFGDISGEYWLGLQWMHALTTDSQVQMRVDICASNGSAGHVIYEGFNISGRGNSYRLQTGTYARGTIQDYFSLHSGKEFLAEGFCAEYYGGGWWYQGMCFSVNLNGGRYRYRRYQDDGIAWFNFGGHGYHRLMSSQLKIRPLGATGDQSRPYTCPPESIDFGH